MESVGLYVGTNVTLRVLLKKWMTEALQVEDLATEELVATAMLTTVSLDVPTGDMVVVEETVLLSDP